MTARRIALALTGASGSAFGVQFLRRLQAHPGVSRVDLLLSAAGRRCLLDECGLSPEALAALSPKAHLRDGQDLGADLASGSCLLDGMVLLPCSAGALGRIASGTSTNLISRAADVCLKERRPLVLCLRETPLNRIHLENMLRAHDAGAVVMPLSPGYYGGAATLEVVQDAFATRVLDQLGLAEPGAPRWKG